MSSDFLLGVPGKLKTMLDRLTATRAGYLDDLDATVSSRTLAATWTGTKAGYVDTSVSGLLDSIIDSIQSGYVDTTSLSNSSGEDAHYYDVTVSSVDTDKAVAFIVGGATGYSSTAAGEGMDTWSYYDNYWYSRLTCRLSSATNLRLATPEGAGGTERFSGRWYVVEFK